MDIRTESQGDTLRVTGLSRLTADNVPFFRELVQVTLTDQHQLVEVDLSATKTLDSDGVGALISVHKRMRERGGHVRLARPVPFVLETLKLLKLDQVFEVTE